MVLYLWGKTNFVIDMGKSGFVVKRRRVRVREVGIDGGTGEDLGVLDEYALSESVLVPKKTPYMLVYGRLVGMVMEKKVTPHQLAVFMAVAMSSGQGTGLVRTGAAELSRNPLTKGINPQVVRNCMSKLARLGIVQKAENAVYYVNPLYVWRGSGAERRQKMEEWVQDNKA